MKQYLKKMSEIVPLREAFLFFIVFLSCLLLPQNSFGQDAGRNSPTPPSGSAYGMLIVWAICYARRKKAIGGWLLFYFIRLYLGMLVWTILIVLYRSNYIPGGWDNNLHYSLYVLTTIPGYIILIAQVVLSYYLISETRRDWKYIELLRKLLMANFIVSVGSIVIDATLWSENVIFSIASALDSFIWFFYFKKSVRVEYVFKDKEWNWQTFLERKKSRHEERGQLNDTDGVKKTEYFCPECNRDINRDQRYCPGCGTEIDWGE